MSVTDIEAGTISFAHLSGLARISAAKAEAPDDDKKDDDKDAADDSDDASAEDDKEDKDAAKAESDDDEDDKPKDKAKKATSTSGIARGAAQERARWTAVLASKSFARSPTVGAHLLANTSMDASAILAVLRDAPAASSPDAGRSARNPNLGVTAPAVAATTSDRWGATFKRAGISK